MKWITSLMTNCPHFLRTKANFYFVIWEFMNSSILIISKATPGMIERYFAAGQQVEKVCSINSRLIEWCEMIFQFFTVMSIDK